MLYLYLSAVFPAPASQLQSKNPPRNSLATPRAPFPNFLYLRWPTFACQPRLDLHPRSILGLSHDTNSRYVCLELDTLCGPANSYKGLGAMGYPGNVGAKNSAFSAAHIRCCITNPRCYDTSIAQARMLRRERLSAGKLRSGHFLSPFTAKACME